MKAEIRDTDIPIQSRLALGHWLRQDFKLVGPSTGVVSTPEFPAYNYPPELSNLRHPFSKLSRGSLSIPSVNAKQP